MCAVFSASDPASQGAAHRPQTGPDQVSNQATPGGAEEAIGIGGAAAGVVPGLFVAVVVIAAPPAVGLGIG